MLEAKLGNHFTAILIELSDDFLETAQQLCDVLSVFFESVRKKTEKYTLSQRFLCGFVLQTCKSLKLWLKKLR